jgi:uncharacterized protein (TIGR03435 family)
MKAIVMTLLAAAVTSAVAAQSPLPKFEVVSVRENKSVGQGGSMSAFTGSQFTAINFPLRAIILAAFELRDVQLVNAPDWVRTARFDISAKFPEGTYSLAERRLIVQRMLEDRFQLRARRDTRELPVYRLVMARDDRRLGPKLTPSDIDCVKFFAEKRSQIIGQGPIGPGGARPGCMMVTQRNYILAGTRSMAELARGLESVTARPVTDSTGLIGNFDIDLQWIPEPGVDAPFQGPEIFAPAASGSIFTALQEQLGLKLESSRGPMHVLVMESVSRPTPD